MAGSYTIEQLGQKAVWENDANKGDYPAFLSGVEGEVLVFHDSSSDYDPPKIGDELYGEVTQDKRGRARFRRGSKGSAPGGHRPRSGGGDKGGYSKGDIARITRSHSQEMAVRLIVGSNTMLYQGNGEGGLDFSNATDAGAFLNGVVARLADWFDADVQAAERRVTAPQPQLQQEVPADTEGLQPAQARSDESIPF